MTASLKQNFIMQIQTRNANTKINIAEKLTQAGIKFDSKKQGGHLVLKSSHGLIDFFPLTEKWVVRQHQLRGRGIKNIIDFLTQK